MQSRTSSYQREESPKPQGPHMYDDNIYYDSQGRIQQACDCDDTTPIADYQVLQQG
jgi:hypothetical protein